MITFLSSPKPFVGSAGVIQRNAILSWKAVHPNVEIIIYGDGKGVAETCKELGVVHIPDVECSNSGIPFFNSIVEHATIEAKYNLQCYLNCDIILTESILSAGKAVEFDKFLITGQRIDLGEDVFVDVTQNNWKKELLNYIYAGKSTLHSPTGMDYFIFPRGMWQKLATLVIGRGGYDNALVLYAMRNNIPFINGSLAVIALHQFHDYGHITGGHRDVLQGEDAMNNNRLHSNYHSSPNSADAAFFIIEDKLVKNEMLIHPIRKIELIFRFKFGLEKFSLIFRLICRILMFIKTKKQRIICIHDIIR